MRGVVVAYKRSAVQTRNLHHLVCHEIRNRLLGTSTTLHHHKQTRKKKRKLCNARIQEFIQATKQEFASKKGLASTTDVNLRTTLLSTHTKVATKVNN